MKKILLGLAGVLVALALVLVVRTARFSPQPKVFSPIPKIFLDEKVLAERVAAALRIPTRSYTEVEKIDPSTFRALNDLMRKHFPRVFRGLKVNTVGTFSLLLEWTGQDPKLDPILLLAHQDVVPIAPGTESQWQHPPFSGAIADGFIWGRGAIDDKASVWAILEAIENKLAVGFRPARTVYFGFGEDEEIGGPKGAKGMAELLRRRGVKLESVLDEGGIIGEGLLDGVVAPVAFVGIAEKGYVSVTMIAKEKPGHSSVPPKKTAIGRVARAITRLEAHPFPTRLDGPARQMLEAVGPEMGWDKRVVLSNLWLFSGLVKSRMEGHPQSNATIRTTIAPTIFQAGEKENTLPGTAKAVINFRTLPGYDTAGVVAYVKEVIQDPDMEITSSTHGEATPVSPTEAKTFKRLSQVISEVFPEVVLAPNLTVASTDSKHFKDLTQNIHRFLPIRFGTEDVGRFHGTNERLAVSNYAELVRFYLRYLEIASTP